MNSDLCLRCHQSLGSQSPHYGQHLSCFEELFKVQGRKEFYSLVRKESHSGSKKSLDKHLTSYFSGNYRKYEARLGELSYILKFSKPEYPELSLVEFVSNKIAYYCGLKIPVPFSLVDFENQEIAFVSKNFMDQLKTHANLVHLFHYLKKGSEHYNVETLSEVIFRETRSYEDIDQYFKTLLYDALVGNHDRHGRNFALIETAQGKRLSPIYDNPSSLGLEPHSLLGAQFSPRGKIATQKTNEPEMLDYLKEMDRLGVIKIAKDFFSQLDINKVRQIITESPLSTKMKQAFHRLVEERYSALAMYLWDPEE